MSTTKRFVFHEKIYEEQQDGTLAKVVSSATASATGGQSASATVVVDNDGVANFAFVLPIGPMGPAATYVGACSTAANTAAKEISITGFTLASGVSVTVTFTNGNSATNATLNVSSTGAKAIMYYTSGNTKAAVPAFYIKAGETITLAYDGTDWVIVDNDDYGDLDGDYTNV